MPACQPISPFIAPGGYSGQMQSGMRGVQDAFEHLGRMDEELRSRIRIQYVDTYGEVEAGVDGGGLFKDFMENLVKEGFNPEVGLFRTTAEQKLFPSPAAALVVANALALFEFLGKMLGKAMYEVSAQPMAGKPSSPLPMALTTHGMPPIWQVSGATGSADVQTASRGLIHMAMSRLLRAELMS